MMLLLLLLPVVVMHLLLLLLLLMLMLLVLFDRNLSYHQEQNVRFCVVVRQKEVVRRILEKETIAVIVRILEKKTMAVMVVVLLLVVLMGVTVGLMVVAAKIRLTQKRVGVEVERKRTAAKRRDGTVEYSVMSVVVKKSPRISPAGVSHTGHGVTILAVTKVW